MGLFNFSEKESPPPLTGGPLGLGDPNDKRLRKTEKDIIIPKMLRDEALKKCDNELNDFLHCAKREGLLVVFNCRKENDTRNDCVSRWVHDEKFVQDITEKYLEARTYYRQTGEPLVRYERKRGVSGGGFC